MVNARFARVVRGAASPMVRVARAIGDTMWVVLTTVPLTAQLVGAGGAGLRAVRVDITRSTGPSAAEFVARSHGELAEYLLTLR